MENIYLKLFKTIAPHLHLVYLEPMREEDIVSLESSLEISIKPAFRLYLKNIGLVQDLIPTLNSTRDEIIENYDFVKTRYAGYLPISNPLETDEDSEEEDEELEDYLLLINNTNEADDWIYKVYIDEDDKMSELIRTDRTFTGLLEDCINRFEASLENRTDNENKFREVGFVITINPSMKGALRIPGFRQLTAWLNQYEPNIFGSQIARFEVLEEIVEIERDESQTRFNFEFGEAVIDRITAPKIEALEELIKKSGLPYEKYDLGVYEEEE